MSIHSTHPLDVSIILIIFDTLVRRVYWMNM